MPSAIAAVSTWYAGLSVGAAFAVRFAVTVGLSLVSSKLFGPKIPRASQSLQAMQLMSRSAIEYRRVVYGQAVVSGPVMYNNVSGTSNEYLWYQIALADHPSEDLVEIRIDSTVIPKADISWTAGTGAADGTGTGDVATSAFVGDNSTKALQAYYYLGSTTQPVSGNLNSAFSDITSAHRARGVTHIICKFLYNEDTQEVWDKRGQPNDISAVIKGRKIYDPRLDSTVVIDPDTSPQTFGSGAHRYNDDTTWAWSDNPALCIADYLTQIMGVDPATKINWPFIAAAADDCDTLVDIPPVSSPATQEKRFTCNGALSLGSGHKENLDALLSSCDGHLSYSQGQWKLRASVWEATGLTITADDLAGDVSVRGQAPRSERFNTIRGVFIDPDRNYEAVEFPHVTSASYVTRDAGRVISYDLELPFTNSQYMAQRIAYRNLEQGDNQIIVDLQMNLAGAQIASGDRVALDLPEFGWTGGSVLNARVIDWSRNDDGTFQVVCRQDDSADYADPLVAEYSTSGALSATTPSDIVPPPTSLSAGGVAGGIQLQWTNPPSRLWDWIDIYQSTDNQWSNASLIASVRADTYTVPLAASEQRWYWIRARVSPSTQSLREPNNDTSTIQATSVAGTDGESIYVATIYRRATSTPAAPGTDPSPDDFGSYNFTTKTLTPPANWSASPPGGTDPMYSSVGTFSIVGTTGTDTADGSTWSSPALFVSNGNDGDDALAVNYTNNSHAVPVTNLGVEDWTGSGGNLFVFEGTSLLTLASNSQGTGYAGLLNSEFQLNITPLTGDTLGEPAITGSGTTTATLGNWSSDLTQVTTYRIDVYVKDSGGNTAQLVTDVTLTPADQGSNGDPGADGSDAITIQYTNQAHAVPVTNTGTPTWTGSGGLFYAYDGGTVLTLKTNTQTGDHTGLTNGTYNLNITPVSGLTLTTEPPITGQSTTTATLGSWNNTTFTAVTVYRITAYIKDNAGTNHTLSLDVTLTPADQGDDGAAGADGDPGLPGASKILFFDDADTGLSSTSAGKYGFDHHHDRNIIVVNHC